MSLAKLAPRRATWMSLLALGALLLAGPAAADDPADRSSTADFEVRFMKGMIDHHHMAVEMSELCVSRATHSQLRSLCRQMSTAQQREIRELRGWLRHWYGMDHEPMMSPEEEQQLERLASLRGAEFEKEFMKMMIQHHLTAVRRSAQCVERASNEHDKLEDMCEMMIEDQVDEVRRMKHWLCDWHHVCR